MADDNVRSSDEGLDWLHARQERFWTDTPEEQTNLELGLMRLLLEAELEAQQWTLEEIGMIFQVCQVSPMGARVSQHRPTIWFLVHDKFLGAADPLGIVDKDERAAVEGLLQRLAKLGPTAAHALEDAVSRWLEAHYDHTAEDWAKVGVRIVAGG